MNYLIMLLGAVLFIGGGMSVLKTQYQAEARSYKFMEFYVEDGKLVVLVDRKKVSPEWLVYMSAWTTADLTGKFESYRIPDAKGRQYKGLLNRVPTQRESDYAYNEGDV